MTSEESGVRGVLQYKYQLPLTLPLVLLELQGEAPGGDWLKKVMVRAGDTCPGAHMQKVSPPEAAVCKHPDKHREEKGGIQGSPHPFSQVSKETGMRPQGTLNK